jgi:hypothetical protein
VLEERRSGVDRGASGPWHVARVEERVLLEGRGKVDVGPQPVGSVLPESVGGGDRPAVDVLERDLRGRDKEVVEDDVVVAARDPVIVPDEGVADDVDALGQTRALEVLAGILAAHHPDSSLEIPDEGIALDPKDSVRLALVADELDAVGAVRIDTIPPDRDLEGS